MNGRPPDGRIRRLVIWSCVVALMGLALMVWSVLDPRPLPIVFAMSIGQLIGTISLLLYLGAIVAEFRRLRTFEPRPPP